MNPPTHPRRGALAVPASESHKVAKALACEVDEVVIDLEDAIPLDQKTNARAGVAPIARRLKGQVAVRVNAFGTPWHDEDLAAAVRNDAVTSIVLPKAEDPTVLSNLASHLDVLEQRAGRTKPLGVQALVESPRGVHQAPALARASKRVNSLILGYADLSASMGRRVDASWQFAQDAVLLAARLAGIQAVDDPLLTIADDDMLSAAATTAESLGFDGKWVIHPAQIGTVQQAFTPSEAEIADAREIIAVMEAAATQGRGALQWRGRMLDEAIAARARRTLERADAQVRKSR